jgi:hypothetical protein
LAKDSESYFYGYRCFVTDGDKFIMGVEAPSSERSRDDKNKFPGAIFLSIDAGETFKTFAFPYNIDPTPTVSDEYIFITYVPKK